MSRGCLICVKPVGRDSYHPACLQQLFSFPVCPSVNLAGVTLRESIARQTGRISISGVQQKLVVDLSSDGTSLQPADKGRYILKPQVRGFHRLPENEHVTMRLAELVGLPVPLLGLIRLEDASLAYLVKRFDRTDEIPPAKLRQEDLCSLSLRNPSEKYQGSAEECADIVRKLSATPKDSLSRLFTLFVFSHWVSNEDLHLKNLSMRVGLDGKWDLSPAYDLLSTRLYTQLKQGKEALSLNGKREQLTREDFVELGGRCDLDRREAEAMIDAMLTWQQEAEAMIHRSALARDDQILYIRWMRRKRLALLAPRTKRKA